MKLELKRIDPIRCANLVAVVQAIMMLVAVLIMVPFMLLVFSIGALAEQGQPVPAEMGIILVLFLFYPVLGLIFGWIFGFIAAWVYNLLARWIGGILYDVDVVGEDSVPSPTLSGSGVGAS